MLKDLIEFCDEMGYIVDEAGNVLFEELDSIELVNLVVGLEEKFDIEIQDDYLLAEYYQSIQSIEDIVLISKKMGDLYDQMGE